MQNMDESQMRYVEGKKVRLRRQCTVQFHTRITFWKKQKVKEQLSGCQGFEAGIQFG